MLVLMLPRRSTPSTLSVKLTQARRCEPAPIYLLCLSL